MSATIFDHKEQLKVPFLSPNERVNEAQDDIAASPSDHSLDSSRRTMNYNAEERERDFTSSFVVELSSSPRKTSLNDDYDDYDEEEEENDDVPSVSDGLLNRNYYILSNSTSNSTIPRLFNPGTYRRATSPQTSIADHRGITFCWDIAAEANLMFAMVLLAMASLITILQN